MPTLLTTLLLKDAEWDESKHPRDASGKFGTGGGAAAGATVRVKVKANPRAEKDRAEEQALHSTITGGERFEGGISAVYRVKLADGGEGMFKPDSGSGGFARDNIRTSLGKEREAGVWEVAKIVGMQDMVPATVIRTVTGGKERGYVSGVDPDEWRINETGSLQRYVPNSEMAFETKNAYDGGQDFARAAVFDYITGNEDRHEGNWLIEKDTGKIALIDHGLCFPESVKITDVSGFMDNAVRQGDRTSYGLVPKLPGSPSKFAKPYVENKDAILGVLTRLGLPHSAIQGVSERIDHIARATDPKDWRRLASGNLEPPQSIDAKLKEQLRLKQLGLGD